MYRCVLCGCAFDRPAARRWKERMPDGFCEPCCQAVCPVCGAGEQYFEEARGEAAGCERAGQ